MMISELIVGVRVSWGFSAAVVLVLDEIAGFLEFSHVVEIGTNAAHRGVGTDFLGGGFRQRGDDQAVVEGAGRLELHLAEQLVVQIAELQPTDVGGEMEGPFETAAAGR